MKQNQKVAEQKLCRYCKRSFSNRKKWRTRGQWQQVMYCSKRCKALASNNEES